MVMVKKSILAILIGIFLCLLTPTYQYFVINQTISTIENKIDYQKSINSVITITCGLTDKERDSYRIGSGVVINYKGKPHILTSYHLFKFIDIKDIKDVWLYKRISVMNPKGLITIDTFVTIKADVIKASKRRDLALCSFDNELINLKPVKINQNRLDVGQPCYLIGSPDGFSGADTLTTGVISKFSSILGTTMIATTCGAYEGSSGGGLFDNTGSLIGILKGKLQTTSISVGYGEIQEWLKSTKEDDDITFGELLIRL